MKTPLSPQLKPILSKEKIVYVFGSGFSTSISGRRSSWYQWINDGIEYILDRAGQQELKARLESDSSAASLIAIAGEVITKTKAAGTYDSWMKASIESMSVTNRSLAQTLTLTGLTKDIITTTNYDTLLESAIGLHSLTYEQPDLAFEMIDKGRADSVLHLHGMYSSAAGVDNIIASQEQYEAIYNDEAAQFIQQLLGTRTLIFIGCGQTTDDVNISRFIKFAGEKLHLNVPYFYLKRSCDTEPALPDNFTVIDYGTDYTDLPDFLHDMMMYRANEFMNRNPIVGRTVYEDKLPADALSALGKYHYSNELLSFVGRHKELDELGQFLSEDQAFLWWAVTGQAGAGKSRLVLELMKRHKNDWYSFFLNDRVTVNDVKSYAPIMNTLVAIDYVQGREQQYAAVIGCLADTFLAVGFRLRILLIERESGAQTGSWTENLVNSFGIADRGRFMAAQYGDYISLADLDSQAVLDLIGEVCISHNLPADRRRDQTLKQEYWKKFEMLHFRPLFVQLFVEAWIDNGCNAPGYDSFEGVLEYVILREQERWLSALNGSRKVCSSLIRLLVRASAGGGLALGSLPQEYEEDWNIVRMYLEETTLPGRQRKETVITFLSDVSQSLIRNDGIIQPMYPDIIREYMFIYYLDEKDCADVAGELWRNAGRAFSLFLHRALSDFRNNPLLIKIIENSPDPYGNIDILTARLALLERTAVAPNETREELLRRLDTEYCFWHGMPDVFKDEDNEQQLMFQLIKFRGLAAAAVQYGALSYKDQLVCRMLECMKEAAAVPLGKLEMMKSVFINERIQKAAAAGFGKLADELKKLNEQIINKSPEDEYAGCVRLTDLNVEMMGCLFQGEFYDAYRVLKRMQSMMDETSAEQMRLLATSCSNFINMSFMTGKPGFIEKGNRLLQYCNELYSKDASVHALYLSGIIYEQQYNMMNLKTGRDTAKQIIEGTLHELGSLELNEETCDVWALTALAYLNTADDMKGVEKLLAGTQERLDRLKGDGSSLAQAWIRMQIFIHQKRGNPVPKDIVGKAFAYVMRYTESENTRSAFVDLLNNSEEKNNKSRYLNRPLNTAIIQDMQYNPLYSGDAAEQYLQLRGYDSPDETQFLDELERNELYGLNLRRLLSLDDDDSSGTYVRPHPKVGPNDPCPCGSGKKFKKCCRGTGKYD